MSWINSTSSDDAEINLLKEKLKAFTNDLHTSNGTIINYDVKSGNVTKEIVHYASENNFDIIIMGVNSGGSHNNPGSHTAEVIKNTGFPVLIIPNANQKVDVA